MPQTTRAMTGTRTTSKMIIIISFRRCSQRTRPKRVCGYERCLDYLHRQEIPENSCSPVRCPSCTTAPPLSSHSTHREILTRTNRTDQTPLNQVNPALARETREPSDAGAAPDASPARVAAAEAALDAMGVRVRTGQARRRADLVTRAVAAAAPP